MKRAGAVCRHRTGLGSLIHAEVGGMQAGGSNIGEVDGTATPEGQQRSAGAVALYRGEYRGTAGITTHSAQQIDDGGRIRGKAADDVGAAVQNIDIQPVRMVGNRRVDRT